MNKLLLQIDYATYIACANTKDEQVLLDILSRARVVKRDYAKNDVMYFIDEIPKVQLVNSNLILPEAPKPTEQPAE